MQVSWIEAEDLKGLLARIALPESQISPLGSKPERQVEELLAVSAPADSLALLSSSITAQAPDPFEAMAPAAAFVDSQPPPDDVAALPVSTPDSLEPTGLPAAEEEPAADHAPAILPLARIRDKLRAIRQRAHDSGMLAKAPAPQAPVTAATDGTPAHAAECAPATGNPLRPSAVPLPCFAPPAGGGAQERLAAFATWASAVLGDNGGQLLVMRDNADVLWSQEPNPGLVLSTMMAWSAGLRTSAQAACRDLLVVRQSLASGQVLTVIPCAASPGSLLHIAVTAPEALPDAAAEALREALTLAVQENAR